MSFKCLSIPAVLVATVLGASSASACATADLAGDWFATIQHGAPGYCTLTVGTDGAITASGCWQEKIKAVPQFTVAGTFAVDDACLVTATLTPAKPTLAKRGKGGRHGGHNDNKDLTLAGKLLIGGEVVNGILTRANGEFGAVVFTKLK